MSRSGFITQQSSGVASGADPGSFLLESKGQACMILCPGERLCNLD